MAIPHNKRFSFEPPKLNPEHSRYGEAEVESENTHFEQDEGKQHRQRATSHQAEEDAYEAASGVEEDAVSEPRDAGVWRQS